MWNMRLSRASFTGRARALHGADLAKFRGGEDKNVSAWTYY